MATPATGGGNGYGPRTSQAYGQGYGPSPGRMPSARTSMATSRGDSLADILERVLDKGVVIAGDIVINVLDIELLTLKLRLLVASADTAKEMGIDWWTSDPFLSGRAKELESENKELRERLDRLERAIEQSRPAPLDQSASANEPAAEQSDGRP